MQRPREVLAFGLWGDLAHYKKYYTTMSPLSFSIPTGTVLRGILGAILGIPADEAPEQFHDTYIGLALEKPVKKVTIPLNNVKVTSKKHFSRYEQHKPSNYEFVKDPAYLVYVNCEQQDMQTELYQRLREHRSVYTVSLGLSETLANFGSARMLQVQAFGRATTDIRTIVPRTKMKPTRDTFENARIFAEKVPVRMLNSREVIQYEEYLFDADGAAIDAEVDNVLTLEDNSKVVLV